ncbi:DNA helicase-2 / ATP-dependent DNA helicase PcrA [Pseudovibrio denitrificans]|uniref:DNA 3'-5' helicase n=1 Tax=Pseudovibrio denitrificans TaxID=258256 RepID=A0A1I6ZV90_9HYPH|nr:ATP-dependent helicase [Pseudovibrio denitrificans]SFT66592.1 DNA helicase-2 / ATP-dependent DNA helicase PcrA [Pseudovibrio denitrificans]
MISLTEEQKAAVEHDRDLLLSACPGSGKTRVILAKLLSVAEEVLDTPYLVGCITYTNAAVDEIESRLRIYGSNASAEKCEVSTIHSFLLQFILRPYAWLLPEIPSKFKVLTREAEDFEQIVNAVEDEIGRTPSFRALEDYSSLRMSLNGEPCGQGYERGLVTTESAYLYWRYIRNRGFVDFSMILYYSWKILEKFPFVGLGVASKFKWLLVDEFQDTSDIQIEIFRQLRQYLTTQLFMVGDDNQSIYSFAGARPDLAKKFAQDIGATMDLSLSANFRSTPTVVDVAETLIPNQPPMHSSGELEGFKGEVEYVHVNFPVDAITDHFLPELKRHNIPIGNAAVLAPWWTHLFPVARRLREFDVPVFGPGARPYRRSRVFSTLAEQLGACVEANHYLGLPNVERALFRLIMDLTGNARFDLFSYDGRQIALSLIYNAKEISTRLIGGIDWLEETAKTSAYFLIRDGWLPSEAQELITLSVQEMKADMKRSSIDVANLEIADLGLFANPDKALKLITLHNSKGREFDAVAMISMNEGHIPHFTAQDLEEIEEAKRLFYVGMTRAKQYLLISSDRADRRNPPTRFITQSRLV